MSQSYAAGLSPQPDIMDVPAAQQRAPSVEDALRRDNEILRGTIAQALNCSQIRHIHSMLRQALKQR